MLYSFTTTLVNTLPAYFLPIGILYPAALYLYLKQFQIKAKQDASYKQSLKVKTSLSLVVGIKGTRCSCGLAGFFFVNILTLN